MVASGPPFGEWPVVTYLVKLQTEGGHTTWLIQP